MHISYRMTAIVSTFVVGVSVAVFVVLNHNRPVRTCCGVPLTVLVAKVSIAKGISGSVIGTKGLYSIQTVPMIRMPKGAFLDPSEFRGEVTTRTISSGALLTASDFALRGPI